MHKKRHIDKFNLFNMYRIFVSIISKLFNYWEPYLIFFKPETVIGWHKKAFKFY